MAFRHGVYKSEVPTSIIAPAQGESGLPVVIGTAPVFMGDISCVNKPVLVHTYEEAVKIFGYSDDWESWTLCEFMYSQFALYGQSPCVLINVFDPHKHVVNGGQELEYPDAAGYADCGKWAMVYNSQASEPKYSWEYDENDHLIVHYYGTAQAFPYNVHIAHPEMVTAADIIGGYDAAAGTYSGLELVNQVYPKYRLVPGLICCPKWSENSEVAAVMRAKAENINGLFSCTSVVDIPSDSGGALTYTSAPEWKSQHGYTSEREIVCWPKVSLGGKVYHLSTHVVGLINRTDSRRGDIPYKSPSNELMQIDSCVNGAGNEIMMSIEQANYLNSQGIMTVLNWTGGWRAWGNRTGAYPASSDVKDVFIPVRRMMDYLGNIFITTFWQKTDEPMSPRLVRTIVNSFNMYINSLVAIEALLGGRVEFREDENAYTDLMNGILKFHIFITPPVPAEVIEGIFEYDPEYLSVLYESI